MAALANSRAQITAQAHLYPYMDEAMEVYGQDYTWSAYETTTYDGYILTMFRITGDHEGEKIEGQASKGPLLLQHGIMTDSIAWF